MESPMLVEPETVTRPFPGQLALAAPTAGDRIAEWREKGEAFVRERPVAALIIAAAAGLLAGRLFRFFLSATARRAPLEQPEFPGRSGPPAER
jgi:hypothetical protein